MRLWGASGEIHLTVKDSGAGFDREAAKKSRGLGLISMEERLKLVEGMLSIESQPKSGTTIHARVPLRSGSDSMRAAGYGTTGFPQGSPKTRTGSKWLNALRRFTRFAS